MCSLSPGIAGRLSFTWPGINMSHPGDCRGQQLGQSPSQPGSQAGNKHVDAPWYVLLKFDSVIYVCVCVCVYKAQQTGVA